MLVLGRYTILMFLFLLFSPYISYAADDSTAYNPEPIITATWSSLNAGANNLFVSAENAGNCSLVANRTAVNDWERFQVIQNSDGSISLLSKVNNKYVQVDLNHNSRLIASAVVISTWEKFWMADAGNGLVTLKSFANNKFVSADLNLGSVLYANRDVASIWEKFAIRDA